MKFELPGLPTMATLGGIAVLVCWLGIGGAIISEINVQGVLPTIEKWQTLIGVGAALAVSWIAVQPVWRQVRIMSAQAALLLGPAIQEDLDAVDRDKEILSLLRECDDPLRYVSAKIDFADVPKLDKAFLNEIDTHLIGFRSRIKKVSEADWACYCDRLRLTDHQRQIRNEFRNLVSKLMESSTSLSLRLKGRAEESVDIIGSLVKQAGLFVNKARDQLSEAFTQQELRILVERKRLLKRGKVISDAMDAIN